MSNITPQLRVKQFRANILHVNDGLLFCSICNKVLNFHRRQTVRDHIDDMKHKEAVKRTSTNTDSASQPKRQCTIGDVLKRQADSNEVKQNVIHNFLVMMTAANIPIEKADHPAVREFLRKHGRSGGYIPLF